MHLTPSPRSAADDEIYPSGDGRPLAETPIHCRNLFTLIDVLDRRFADDPLVYVSGNMFVYYVPGDKRKHVAPDVFFVRGVPKDKPRDYYLVWEETRAPDLVIELTSSSTCEEDLEKKWLYQNMLRVHEYVLFDPRGEYLDPPLQGFRLKQGDYVPIGEIEGRLPSEVTGLHFQVGGEDLRLYDPGTGRWLPTASELLAQADVEHQRVEAELDRAAAERDRAKAERDRAKAERDCVAAERDRVSADNERLQQQLNDLRLRLGHTEQ